MNRQYTIGAYLIDVNIERNVVSLRANYALRQVISKGNLFGLVNLIRKDYQLHFGQALKISANSLAMEIAGHMYAYLFSLFLRKIASFRLLRKFSYHLCRIDCGEKGYDWNRKIWDITGIMAPVLFSEKG